MASFPIKLLINFNFLSSFSTPRPTFTLNALNPYLIALSTKPLTNSLLYPLQPTPVVYPGNPVYSISLISLDLCDYLDFSKSIASYLVIKSVTYLKSRQFTNYSGDRSNKSLQTGLFSNFPHKSQKALIIPAKARCVTPFSGPTHLS